MRLHASLLLLASFLTLSGRAEEPRVIELKNGTRIVGTVQKEEAGKLYIEAELIGSVVIDASAVVQASAAENATPPASTSAPQLAAAPSGAPGALPKNSKDRVVWKRSISVNGSYNSAAYVQGEIPGAPPGLGLEGSALGLSGRQKMVQLSGTIARVTPLQAVVLTGSYTYADYAPAGRVVDNWNTELTFTQMLSDKRYLLARSTYKVDEISLIDHSFEQVLGYGFKIIDNERTQFDIIPGLSEVNERKGTAFDDEWILSVGFLQNLEHAFNERVSLQQRFKYRVGVEDSEVWSINAYLGINSALSERVSLNVGLTYTYDNTLGPLSPSIADSLLAAGLPPSVVSQLRPANKDQLQLTTGIEFSF